MVIVLASFGEALADPVANAGPDQVVFDQVTLDGSASAVVGDDPPPIITYEWLLVHQDNPDASMKITTFAEPVVTVYDLAKGFYSVILTVEDGAEAKSRDAMNLVAAGKWMLIPSITSMDPKSVLPGEMVTLVGDNFGAMQEAGSDVMMGKKSLQVDSWNDNEIRFFFPVDVYDCEWFKGDLSREKRVRVVIGEAESNKKKITINTPCP
jgi:hypothetical protein